MALGLILLGCGGIPQPFSPDSPGQASATPPIGPPTASTTSPDDAGDFDSKVEQVRGVVSKWDNGTGLVIQYLNQSTRARMTTVYVDPTPPEWKPAVSKWLVLSKALANDEVISTVSILLPVLEPGRWEAGSARNDIVIAAALGTSAWAPSAPDTAFSSNSGGWCKLELHAAQRPGHLEGRFQGKLTTNNGQSFYTVESGYLYVSR